MPELGALDPKQAASLASRTPAARQSGQWKGRSFIQGGRANVRRALYMRALVAARYNPDLKAKYNSLIASGNRRRSLWSRLCVSSSQWPVRSSKPTAYGSKNVLDHNGN